MQVIFHKESCSSGSAISRHTRLVSPVRSLDLGSEQQMPTPHNDNDESGPSSLGKVRRFDLISDLMGDCLHSGSERHRLHITPVEINTQQGLCVFHGSGLPNRRPCWVNSWRVRTLYRCVGSGQWAIRLDRPIFRFWRFFIGCREHDCGKNIFSLVVPQPESE